MIISKKAQAATELAVFGAIIIFIIGTIVRSSLMAGYTQNAQLKSVRQALLTSYQSSVIHQKSGRLNASFAYIEDRLSPDIGKYGATDRQQYFVNGSGTMTNRLNYPLDPEELADPGNVPTTDFMINGKRFTFTTAAMVRKNFNPPAGYLPAYYVDTVPDPAGHNNFHYQGWNFKCLQSSDQWHGCPIFYTHIPRGASGYAESGTADFSADELFDLNRNDIYTDDPVICGGGEPPTVDGRRKVCREDIAWQWNMVNGVQGSIAVDAAEGNYPSWDVDGDTQEETIYQINANDMGIIANALILDFQEGDLDSSNSQNGLLVDMAIYTRTQNGTYLKVKEGKLYNPENNQYARFVRSANARDQVEIVERMIGLNGNTGHICDGAGHPSSFNPSVEACSNDCFSPENRQLTCFETPTKILYVRSRLWDKAGRFWKTSTTGTLP